MIQDGVNGFLFENGNANQLKEKIENIINDPKLIELATRHITKPYSMNEVAEIIEKEYIDLIEEVSGEW